MNNDRELLQQWLQPGAAVPVTLDATRILVDALRARLSQCDRCGEVDPAEIHTCTPKQHWSDCAVHSEPAYPAGECDCGGFQPEQEPVAWHEPGAYSNVTVHEKWAKENGWLPLYTAPPQREWQGLTDEEMRETLRPFDRGSSFSEKIRAIEAKLREKNT